MSGGIACHGGSSGAAPSEIDIKASVICELIRRKRLAPRTAIANEYPLPRLGVRADLAICGKSFVGVEIKSAADTLRRLDGQMRAYSLLFDRVILVLATKHLAGFDKGQYPWLEVWEIANNGIIKTVRSPATGGKQKPPVRYEQFMTLAEMKRFSPANGGSFKTAFLTAFRHKFGDTSRDFWEAVAARPISSYDVARLSRFRSRKEKSSAHALSQVARWIEWLEALNNIAEKNQNQSVQVSSVSYSLCSSP